MIFKSAKSAIGWALAVQGYTAGLAHISDTRGGPKPDRQHASSVMACVTRAGIDPHAESPVLDAVHAWATGGEVDPGQAGKLDAALRKIARQLIDAGIVDPRQPELETVRWRAIAIDGVVRAHATLGPGASSRAKLLERISKGLEAPEHAELCPVLPSPRETLIQQLSEDLAKGDMSAREVTLALVEGLGVGLRRAQLSWDTPRGTLPARPPANATTRTPWHDQQHSTIVGHGTQSCPTSPVVGHRTPPRRRSGSAARRSPDA